VVRVPLKREFRAVGLAHHYRAAGPQPGDGQLIRAGDIIRVQFASPGSSHPAYRNIVFDSDGHTVPRAERASITPSALACPGRTASAPNVRRYDRVDAWVDLFNAAKNGIDDFDR